MQTKLKDKFRIAKDYLHFRMGAHSRFSIHSPFLFELVNDVLRDDRTFYAFEDIEKARRSLLGNTLVVEGNHVGEQSRALPQSVRKIGDVTKVTAVPVKYGELLFRLVNYLHPANMLELGTGVGISTLYIASAAAASPCITLEGSPALAKIAQQQFAGLHMKNVELMQGHFKDTLHVAINKLGKIHFVFLDGDHRKESVINNMRQILPYLADDATVVVDDIYWSEEMKEAWKELVQLPGVTLSIDLFRMGILFFKSGIKVKQHLKVVIYKWQHALL